MAMLGGVPRGGTLIYNAVDVFTYTLLKPYIVDESWKATAQWKVLLDSMLQCIRWLVHVN